MPAPTTSVRPLLRITRPSRAGATTARPTYGVDPARRRASTCPSLTRFPSFALSGLHGAPFGASSRTYDLGFYKG